MIKLPPFLKPGSLIAITCPSGYLPANHAVMAEAILTQWGFRVIVGKTVGNSFHYFSGDDDLRYSELQSFLDNPEVAAIIAGRGGYGLSRIIDRLDFSAFQKQPKWVIGFSDITVLHAQIHNLCGIASIHGPMCHGFMGEPTEKPWIDTLHAMLKGEAIHYFSEGDEQNRKGIARGVLTGGNLAIMAHLCGSRSQPDTKDKILFLEEVGEYKYAIDRMLLTLKRAGMFEGLAGLVCGGFTDIKDTERPLGIGIQELILEKVAGYDYPVCFGFSAGHIEQNFPIMLGRQHHLSVSKEWVRMQAE